MLKIIIYGFAFKKQTTTFATMLRGFSIGLAILIFCSACRDFLPLVEYHFNKDFIRDVLCINKDKPEMKCDGKCYLKKSLSASHQQTQGKSFPLPHENHPGILPSFSLRILHTILTETHSPLIGAAFTLLPGVLRDISHPPESIRMH